MLETLDLDKKIDKEAYDKSFPELREKLRRRAEKAGDVDEALARLKDYIRIRIDEYTTWNGEWY